MSRIRGSEQTEGNQGSVGRFSSAERSQKPLQEIRGHSWLTLREFCRYLSGSCRIRVIRGYLLPLPISVHSWLVLFRRAGGDDFFEARIATQRIPERE